MNSIDWQVCLVRLVHLHKNNFRLFLREQTDKRQISICTMSKQETIRLNYLGFNFPLDSLQFHASMSTSKCPRFHVHISMPMSPCLHVHVSMYMSPCLRVSCLSMPQCFHVSMSLCPCLRVCGIPQKENRTNRRRQLPSAYCKPKTEVCFSWLANDKR